METSSIGSVKYTNHSTVDQYKRAAPKPVAKSIEPQEKYENVSLPWRINFFEPTGVKLITSKNNKTIKIL